MSPIKSFKDLEVYNISHLLAMDIYNLTKEYPAHEKYSLTDQIRRSSRSVSVNIVEGWGKRTYENVFKRHLIDANGSLEETREWLQYSFDCKYIDRKSFNNLLLKYKELGAKIFSLHDTWTNFKPKRKIK